MIQMLETKQLAGAVLDVTDDEPLGLGIHFGLPLISF